MAEIKLVPKGKIGITVEAEVIRPDAFAKLSKEEIERLQVWQGPRELPLSEFFEVDVRAGEAPEDTKIVIDGDVSRVKRIGQGMKSGRIEILGSAGMHLGAEMAGGSILVQGDADSWAGMEMKGGLLQIEGNAGDHVGSAYRGSWRGMTGGQIRIERERAQPAGRRPGGRIDHRSRKRGKLLRHSPEWRPDTCQGQCSAGIGRRDDRRHQSPSSAQSEQFCPGFVDAGREDNPKVGELQLEGKFAKFNGDFAISKNPKGILYCREV